MATSAWKGHISFGLITIPVRLLRAARSERVPLRELYRVPEAGRPEHEPDEEEAAPLPFTPASRRQAADEIKPGMEPPPEPVYEPVRRVVAGQSSDQPAPAA